MPQTLALVHLITAGFMLQAMCGAMLQFIPVAAGGNVPRPQVLAWLVHPALLVATPCLVMAFLSGEKFLFLLAIPLFALAGAVFISAVGHALLRISVASPTVTALRLALASLAVTLVLGMLLAWALGADQALPMLELTDSHVAFGLGGWGLILVLGVAAFVVPMFQLTPPYPPLFTRGMAWGVGTTTLVAPLALLWPESDLGDIAAMLLVGCGAVFAAMTWQLQRQRRRKVTDPSYWFFRGAILTVLMAAVVASIKPWFATELQGPLWFSSGVLILGAFVAVINGMLYKIIPFINWLHLQRLMQEIGATTLAPPNMRQMIPERAMQHQMQAYFLALALTLLAVWLPLLARTAGLALAVTFAWLGLNLIAGVRQYRFFREQILLS